MKKISLFLVLVLLLTLVSNIVYAYETTFEVSFEPNTGLVTLKGKANGVTTVRLAKSGIDPQSFSDENLPLDIFAFRANGDFKYEFYMPDDIESTKYSLYLTDKNGNCKREFSYFIPSDADSVVTKLNLCKEKGAFVTLAKTNAGNLGIDPDDALMEDVLGLMFDLYPSYTDSSEFYELYQKCRLICSFSGKNQSQIEELLETFQSEFGIDYENDYSKNDNISSQGKTLACSLLSKMYYADSLEQTQAIKDTADFSDVFKALLILADIKTSEGWVALEEIYTSDGSITDEYIVKKNSSYKSEDAYNVFSKMINMDFENISDISDNFTDAVKQVQKESSDTDKKTPSINKGGSGISGGGSVSVPSSQSTQPFYDPVGGNSVSYPTASVPTLGDNKKDFTDVNSSDWFYEPVSFLGGNNIISGDPSGQYRPYDYITRCEFAKLVVTAFNIEGKGTAFDDVPSDAWYAPYVEKASGASIVNGYDGKFDPDANITRQDAAVILYRAASVMNKEYPGFENPADINDASLYAWTAIGAFYSNGIIKGKGNNCFEPLSNITRAETAQLIYNLILDMSKNGKEV